MKTIIAFLLAFPFIASSQTRGYFPLQIGNAWYFENSSTPAIQVIGDTLINGLSYAKLSKDSPYLQYPPVFYVRIDSSRVYRYYSYTGKDLLLYDFSKSAGDTLYSDSTGFFLACDENQLVLYAGRTRRQWSFAYGNNCADCVNGETLVDSIGWRELWGANYTSRLSKAVLGGITVITSIANTRNTNPTKFDASVYPNPFNSSAILKYSIPRSGNLRITLYNSLGQQVTILFDHFAFAGEATLQIDGNGLASGLYYCHLMYEGVVEVRKLVLLK